MADHNPRFPHTVKVLRTRRDSNGEIVLDEDSNPIYEAVSVGLVAMHDGWMIRSSSGQPIVEKQITDIPCGYRTNTRNLSEAGDVVNYNVTLHCPPFIGELLYDDVLEITDYDRTYRAKMVKKVTFNWGTDVWFDEIKN